MLNYWIRQQNATWVNGALASVTDGVMTFDLSVLSGTILQLHEHTFPAFNTATGSHVLVPNDSVTAYKKVTDLKTILTDSLGVSMSAKYFNLVVWGSVSEDSGDSQLMINLPNGSYATSANAQTDINDTADYSIPADFRGTGFLIARLTIRHQTAGGGTWTDILNTDLRGLFASTSVGGTAGSGLTQAEADTLYSPLGHTHDTADIVDAAITFAKFQDITGPAVVGRTVATLGQVSALTGAQVNSMLPEVTVGIKGVAPSSPGGTTQFLRADSTWAVPADAVTSVFGRSGAVTALEADYSSFYLTLSGGTITGAFDTRGIDDTTVTATRLKINNTTFGIGDAAGTIFGLYRESNTGGMIVGGGLGASTSASLIVYGSAASTPYDFALRGNAGANVIFWDDSTGILTIDTGTGPTKTNALTISATQVATFAGALTVTGAFTSLGFDDNASAERMQLDDLSLALGPPTVGDQWAINTTANTNSMLINGGTSNNGGGINMFGSTHAFNPGDVQLQSSGNILFNWDESLGESSFLTGTGSKTISFKITSVSTVVGSAGAGYDIHHAANDQLMTYSGGNASNAGGNILFAGGAHATLAGDTRLRSGANIWMEWDESVGVCTIFSDPGAKASALIVGKGGQMTFGADGDDVVLEANGSAGSVTVAGSSSGIGASLWLSGSAGVSAFDVQLAGQFGGIIDWDQSAGTLVFSVGTGTTAAALSLAADKDATFSGQINAIAGTTAKASLNIPTGVAKTSPAQGDMWVTATDAFIRINGVSQSIINTGSGAPVDSVFGRTGAVVALVGDYSSFYAPIANPVFTGSFTSPGIDDNATAERLELSDTAMLLGVTTFNTNYSIGRRTQQGRLTIWGGTGSTGPNLVLHGPSDISEADDFELKVDSGQVIKWDESAGTFTLRSGTGIKNVALTVDNSQLATFAGRIDISNAAPELRFDDTGLTGHSRIIHNGNTLEIHADVDGFDASSSITLAVDGTTALTINSSQVANFANAIQIGGVTQLKTKALSIGDWNMDTTASRSVAHGLTAANIRSVDVWIIIDGGAQIYNLISGNGSAVAGRALWDATNVSMQRVLSGFFDGAAFDATSFNRGWVVIHHV
jgi:hypothetical protein